MHSNTSAWGYKFLSKSGDYCWEVSKWRAYPAPTPRYRKAARQVVVRFFDFYHEHPKARRLHANTHKARG